MIILLPKWLFWIAKSPKALNSASSASQPLHARRRRSQIRSLRKIQWPSDTKWTKTNTFHHIPQTTDINWPTFKNNFQRWAAPCSAIFHHNNLVTLTATGYKCCSKTSSSWLFKQSGGASLPRIAQHRLDLHILRSAGTKPHQKVTARCFSSHLQKMLFIGLSSFLPCASVLVWAEMPPTKSLKGLDTAPDKPPRVCYSQQSLSDKQTYSTVRLSFFLALS